MSGRDLDIKRIQVEDQITQRAQACVIVLAPRGLFDPPAVEFGIPGDSKTLTGSTLRPNGSTIQINTAYSGVPNHLLFKGLLEFIDDLTDAQSDVFTARLSAMPKNQPQRKTVTLVFNEFGKDTVGGDPTGSYPTATLGATNSRAVLNAVCRTAGLAIGRNELPEYVIEGTWEVIHQTAVECAEQLLRPFNMFDYLKYYVRTDADGLQILKIDFTEAPPGAVYEIPNVEKVERSFELYMPENRVGTDSILLTGADILGYPNTSPTESPLPRTVFRQIVTKDYFTSSRHEGSIPGYDTWTESRSTIQYICDVFGVDTHFGTLDQLLDAVREGLPKPRIVGNRTTYQQSSDYSEQRGLIKTTEHYFTFSNLDVDGVLQQEEIQETLFVNGKRYEYRLTRKKYSYDDLGSLVATVTTVYWNDGRGNWVLKDTTIDQGDSVAATNAQIQAILEGLQVSPLGGAHVLPDAPPVQPKTQIGQYRLLDGSPLSITNLTPSGGLAPNRTIPQSNIRIGNDPKRAFQINCPGMNYDGLNMVYDLILRQQELESKNAYWERLAVTASLDTVPAVGTAAKAGGSYGVITGVKHDIDSKSGLTTVFLSRLHENG